MLKKSTLFVVGKMCDVEIGCLQIGDNYISWCTQMKYLGIHFRLDYYLDYAVDYAVRKFYTSANSISNHSHFASEISKLFLLGTYCLPLISYSCEALNYNNKQLNRLNVCYSYRPTSFPLSHTANQYSVSGIQPLNQLHLYILLSKGHLKAACFSSLSLTVTQKAIFFHSPSLVLFRISCEFIAFINVKCYENNISQMSEIAA